MAGSPELHYTQQDFNLIPVLNLVAEPIAGSATPSSTNVGKLYRNTSSNRLEYVKDSTTIWSIPASGTITDADVAAGAAIALSKLAVNPLARANHTGTQTASTISDFDTQVNTHRLDQLAAPTNPVSMNSQRLTALADPTGNTDAATMQWVTNTLSAAINGHDWKDAARVAPSTNITISNPGTATFDGVALNAGDRVLLPAQTDATQNGLWIFNGSGAAMTRATDADANSEVTNGMTVPITAGTRAGQMAILTTVDPITLGTTSLTFTFLQAGGTYTQGTGITISGNTISLSVPIALANGGTGATTAAAARTNLNTPQRGFAADVGALTAGTAASVAHGLGTADCVVQVRRKSDGAQVDIGNTIDATNVYLTSDVAVSASTLRVIVEPIS